MLARSLVTLAGALTLLGCGETILVSLAPPRDGGADGAIDGGGDGAAEACADAGCNPDAIWPADATVLVATDEGGGFTPPPPTGSECAMGEAQFTYTRATRDLKWTLCDANVSPWKRTSGESTLAAGDADAVESAMRGVTLSTTSMCGADKSNMKIAVTTPRGTREYLDSFYSCQNKGTYVDGLDAVFSELRKLGK